jgi:hypothetical protein
LAETAKLWRATGGVAECLATSVGGIVGGEGEGVADSPVLKGTGAAASLALVERLGVGTAGITCAAVSLVGAGACTTASPALDGSGVVVSLVLVDSRGVFSLAVDRPCVAVLLT